jgi:hypothetical protein
MTSPATDPGLYDVIVFDGGVSPGIVTLSGHKREQKLDVKDADGQKGASTSWKGEKVGKFTATFELVYDPIEGIDDFSAWDIFVEKLWSTVPPKSGEKPVAKDIWHPDLERNHYRSVILDTMGEMVHTKPGLAKVSVVLSEYYPPKPAKTGGASGSKKGAEDPNDPLVKARKELEDVINEGKTP